MLDQTVATPPAHERAIDTVEPSQQAVERLRPSVQDYRDYKSTSDSAPLAICGPDYTSINKPDGVQLFPTAKRLENDRQAREAINRPDDTSRGPANYEERIFASQVAELARDARENLKTASFDTRRNGDISMMREVFGMLDPATTREVIAEANRQLAGENLRFAQAPSGEVWMGSRKTSNDKYLLDARVRDSDC